MPFPASEFTLPQPHAFKQQLAQSAPADTSAASLYSPAAEEVAIITDIFIANTTTASAAFRLFHDDDGSTYSTATALYYDVSVSANTTTLINDIELTMANPDGNLAAATDTSDALTFTVYGVVQR